MTEAVGVFCLLFAGLLLLRTSQHGTDACQQLARVEGFRQVIVGALIEAPTMYPKLSAERNLRSLARLAGVSDGRVAEVLHTVGLTGREQDPFGDYSLGMKQRLGIAAALLRDPELLILDEPTNNLDPQAKQALLGALRVYPGTVVLVSHDTDFVAELGPEALNRRLLEEIRDYLENGNVRNSVNFPKVYMKRYAGYRLSVVNENVPNMLGQISTALADAGLNIVDMINKSRGELAYTLVDVESEIGQDCVERISATAGVRAVRVL